MGFYSTCTNQTIYPVQLCSVTSQTECSQMNDAISIVSKFTSILSIIGSALIMYRFSRIPKPNRQVYDRLLLGMSFFDLLGSCALFIGNWPFATIPFGEVTSPFCNFQGFVIQLYSATYWYNGCLATNYLLRIRFNWRDYDMAKLEPYLHVCAVTYPIITASVTLGLGWYGQAGIWCWIYTTYAWQRWVFFYAPLWVIMIYAGICMCLIVDRVKQTEKQTAQIRSSHTQSVVARRSQRATRQAFLYISTFLLTWIFGTASRIQNTIIAQEDPDNFCNIFALVFLQAFFTPLQGFFNFVVYIYPRMEKLHYRRSSFRQVCASLLGKGKQDGSEEEYYEERSNGRRSDVQHHQSQKNNTIEGILSDEKHRGSIQPQPLQDKIVVI